MGSAPLRKMRLVSRLSTQQLPHARCSAAATALSCSPVSWDGFEGQSVQCCRWAQPPSFSSSVLQMGLAARVQQLSAAVNGWLSAGPVKHALSMLSVADRLSRPVSAAQCCSNWAAVCRACQARSQRAPAGLSSVHTPQSCCNRAALLLACPACTHPKAAATGLPSCWPVQRAHTPQICCNWATLLLSYILERHPRPSEASKLQVRPKLMA